MVYPKNVLNAINNKSIKKIKLSTQHKSEKEDKKKRQNNEQGGRYQSNSIYTHIEDEWYKQII